MTSRPPFAQPPSDPADAEPFWRVKRLDAMSAVEWESLCDGCGRCCLVKLEDEDTGEVAYTDVGCTLLDGGTCRCREYARRQEEVPDCVRLTPEAVATLPWLPGTCAYRILAEAEAAGEPGDLPPWHPLVSDDPDTVHAAGISVRDRVAGPEEAFTLRELMDRTVDWPWDDGKAEARSRAPDDPTAFRAHRRLRAREIDAELEGGGAPRDLPPRRGAHLPVDDRLHRAALRAEAAVDPLGAGAKRVGAHGPAAKEAPLFAARWRCSSVWP
jgi:uncharacterized cysteine cluster protein YcgN (CxxCxxCC family)